MIAKSIVTAKRNEQFADFQIPNLRFAIQFLGLASIALCLTVSVRPMVFMAFFNLKFEICILKLWFLCGLMPNGLYYV